MDRDAADAVMIKKRRCGREEREKRRLLGKVAENAEGRRDLEERERDGFLSVVVLREAMVDEEVRLKSFSPRAAKKM